MPTSNLIVTPNLADELIRKPLKEGAEEMMALCGYVSPAFVETIYQMRTEMEGKIARPSPIRLRLCVGMAGVPGGVRASQHQAFVKQAMEERAEIRFWMDRRNPHHDKLYVWVREGEPFRAFLGSANASPTAYGRQQNSMVEVEPEMTVARIMSVFEKSTPCQDVPETTFLKPEERDGRGEGGRDVVIGEQARLPLLDSRTGEVPKRSGLNWGQRERRDRNQAYLSIPKRYRDFFPDRGEAFMVVTDDNHTMFMVRAQDGGKALHTAPSNATMGEYFRSRLGVDSGAYVTTEDLRRYGRTDVVFSHLPDQPGDFFMDFSKP